MRTLALAIAALLALAARVGAGEGTDHLRAEVEELYRSVRQPEASGPATSLTPRAIVDRMFDWSAMAEAVLRDHWRPLAPPERAEFTRLFAEVFSRGYVSRIHLVDARTFQYLGDTTVGDASIVKTKVFTRRGSAITVDYVLHASGARRWRIVDVRVESISLVENYRVQFDTVIAKSSYGTLLTRLRDATK